MIRCGACGTIAEASRNALWVHESRRQELNVNILVVARDCLIVEIDRQIVVAICSTSWSSTCLSMDRASQANQRELGFGNGTQHYYWRYWTMIDLKRQ